MVLRLSLFRQAHVSLFGGDEIGCDLVIGGGPVVLDIARRH